MERVVELEKERDEIQKFNASLGQESFERGAVIDHLSGAVKIVRGKKGWQWRIMRDDGKVATMSTRFFHDEQACINDAAIVLGVEVRA